MYYMLDFLMVYTVMGWPVHPLNAKTKAPLLTGWQTLATTDMAQVAEWAKQFPGCAWGTPTSAERAVLDVDPRHGGDKHLAALEAQHGPLPPTPRVLTGGLGHHHYLRCPPGTKCRRVAKSDFAEADSITLK